MNGIIFYQKLYANNSMKVENTDISLSGIFKERSVPKLSDDETKILKDIYYIVNVFSLSSVGCTVEYLKMFWNKIGSCCLIFELWI